QWESILTGNPEYFDFTFGRYHIRGFVGRQIEVFRVPGEDAFPLAAQERERQIIGLHFFERWIKILRVFFSSVVKSRGRCARHVKGREKIVSLFNLFDLPGRVGATWSVRPSVPVDAGIPS